MGDESQAARWLDQARAALRQEAEQGSTLNWNRKLTYRLLEAELEAQLSRTRLP